MIRRAIDSGALYAFAILLGAKLTTGDNAIRVMMFHNPQCLPIRRRCSNLIPPSHDFGYLPCTGNFTILQLSDVECQLVLPP